MASENPDFTCQKLPKTQPIEDQPPQIRQSTIKSMPPHMTSQGLTDKEISIFSRLDTPIKIQDFLDSLDYNLEEKEDTCYSPRLVLRHNKANCIEGALFAAAALYFHGQPPLLGQLITENDEDHVLGLYRISGQWGSLSKSKYPILGYREPVHKTLRELTLTYFENYFTYDGKKSLWGYAKPLNLKKFDRQNWITSEKPLFYMVDWLVKAKTVCIINPAQVRNLRPVTQAMREAGEIWIHKNGLMGYLKKKFEE